MNRLSKMVDNLQSSLDTKIEQYEDALIAPLAAIESSYVVLQAAGIAPTDDDYPALRVVINIPTIPLDDEKFFKDTHVSDAHEVAKGLAIAGILLYPVGVSLLYVVLMLCARQALLSAKQTALSQALSFLVKDYEPAYFWWELLEAWKKLVLVGFLALVLPCLLYTSDAADD